MSIEISILVVIAFAFGWYLGSKITTHLLALSFRQILEDLGVSNDQLRKLARNVGADIPEPEPTTEPTVEIEIRLEQEQEQIYAYRKDNSQFLGQGSDAQALIDHLNLTFANGARLIVREQDGADLLQKNNG
jgi:hypothetical protein